ncbi:MAG: hypothetical protein A2987_02905 [Omnitrophica bacterium RIFCSPLOWO2_01_FULL_45_10]|nr:MAG: hypothetical protein A2987_02905 [Omnitrophica bacterium RIFCSPLOWO2_01_FULL_45_10]
MKKAFGLFLLVGIFISVLLYANINCEAILVIEPALVKTELTQGRATGAFVIKNTGDEEERYRAKAVHFVVTKEGALKEVPLDEYSLAGWIKFNPKEFVLPPKTSRMVRFSVIPQGKVATREYWGAIEFMPLKGSNVKAEDGKGHIFNLQVLSVILVPIYGFVDGTLYSGRIDDISIKKLKDKTYLYCGVTNTGDGILRLKGSCQILDSSGTVVEEIGLKHIIAFTKKERLVKSEIKTPLKPGTYRARVNLASQDSHSKVTLVEEANFYL